MSDSNNDEALVSEIIAGQTERYAVLVDRYKQKVYGVLRGMGAGPQDAQDLAQDTFIKAYRGLADHKQDKRFASWLYTIATNLYKDFCRKQRTREKAVTADIRQEESPESVYLSIERKREMEQRMLSLPENYRLVLLLRYTNDLSYEEISEILKVPVRKVHNDLHRAKKKLKQHYLDEGVTAYEQ